MTKIAIIDTETVSMKGAICEFGITVFEGDKDLNVLSSHGSFINPQTPITFEAMNVHHITEEDVEGAPLIEEVLPEHPLEDCNYVVAHNLPYEESVLPEEYFPENIKRLCTLKLARMLYPVGEVESHKLGVLYYQLGIYKDKRLQENGIQLHSAKDDTFVTGLVLEYMLKDSELTIEEAWSLLYDHKRCKGGKQYKGELWEDVIVKDYSYVEYTFNNVELDQEELDYLEGFLSKYKHVKVEQLDNITFGKLKGGKWSDAVKDDSSYVRWCVDNLSWKDIDQMEYVKELLEKG
ncbi:exodeoxyribonuclease X [Pseudoalteromonas phage PH357]|nr:exodeoxyribonuclease X [Pseudoalteromonas phage PH357]